jgi:hypothetical protein
MVFLFPFDPCFFGSLVWLLADSSSVFWLCALGVGHLFLNEMICSSPVCLSVRERKISELQRAELCSFNFLPHCLVLAH